MDELVAWYRQQLDDDERASKNAGWDDPQWFFEPSRARVVTSKQRTVVSHSDGSWMLESDGHHIARHDPAAVLADVAAKKKLLAALEDMAQDEYNPWAWNHIAILASAYRHRPGWKQKWEV